eukprot:g1458.t1
MTFVWILCERILERHDTEGANCLSQSLAARELQTLPQITSIAKSLGALRPSEAVFQRCIQLGPEHFRSVTFSDAQAVSACLRLADEHRMLVEPACGAAIAAVTEKSPALEGMKRVVLQLCGGAVISRSQLNGYAEQFGLASRRALPGSKDLLERLSAQLDVAARVQLPLQREMDLLILDPQPDPRLRHVSERWRSRAKEERKKLDEALSKLQDTRPSADLSSSTQDLDAGFGAWLRSFFPLQDRPGQLQRSGHCPATRSHSLFPLLLVRRAHLFLQRSDPPQLQPVTEGSPKEGRAGLFQRPDSAGWRSFSVRLALRSLGDLGSFGADRLTVQQRAPTLQDFEVRAIQLMAEMSEALRSGSHVWNARAVGTLLEFCSCLWRKVQATQVPVPSPSEWVAMEVLAKKPFQMPLAGLLRFYGAVLAQLTSWASDLRSKLPGHLQLSNQELALHLSQVALSLVIRAKEQDSISRLGFLQLAGPAKAFGAIGFLVCAMLLAMIAAASPRQRRGLWICWLCCGHQERGICLDQDFLREQMKVAMTHLKEDGRGDQPGRAPRGADERYPGDERLKEGIQKFNPNSNLQMRQFLYGQEIKTVANFSVGGLGLDKVKIGRQLKDSASREAIEKLVLQNPEVEGLKHLVERGAIAKAMSFLSKFSDATIADSDGRVHTSLNLMTRTGRLSSSNPNLQQIPAMDKDCYQVRSSVVPAPGKSFVIADYGTLAEEGWILPFGRVFVPDKREVNRSDASMEQICILKSDD